MRQAIVFTVALCAFLGIGALVKPRRFQFPKERFYDSSGVAQITSGGERTYSYGTNVILRKTETGDWTMYDGAGGVVAEQFADGTFRQGPSWVSPEMFKKLMRGYAKVFIYGLKKYKARIRA